MIIIMGSLLASSSSMKHIYILYNTCLWQAFSLVVACLDPFGGN